jgi:hypothetical protein
LGGFGKSGYSKKHRVTENQKYSKYDIGKSNAMGVNVERDMRNFCMESEPRSNFEGMRGSLQTSIKLYEKGLGHVIKQHIGDAMGPRRTL